MLLFPFSVAFADGPASASSSSSAEAVYVANADSGPVTVYQAGSSGRVRPVRTINNPGLSNTYWDPWTVTLDSSSHVYVQTFLSDATTFVFPPGSSGPPTRVFRVTGPDSQSIAVEVFGRFSSGNVPALRSFTDSSSNFQDAEGIAVGS